MESNTQAGLVIDVGSLYAHFQTLSDKRKRRGLRYSLVLILVIILLAKTCGEDHPSGIAEWAKHRTGMLVDWFKLERKKMPHHTTYRRILAEIVNVEELEQVSSAYLSGRKYFGKQVLVAIDGKVLRGTLDDKQNGTYLLAAYLPNEGIVLMEIAIEGKGSEIPAAYGEKWSWEMLCTRKDRFPFKLWSPEANTFGSRKAISPKWKRTSGCGLSRMCNRSPG